MNIYRKYKNKYSYNPNKFEKIFKKSGVDLCMGTPMQRATPFLYAAASLTTSLAPRGYCRRRHPRP